MTYHCDRHDEVNRVQKKRVSGIILEKVVNSARYHQCVIIYVFINQVSGSAQFSNSRYTLSYRLNHWNTDTFEENLISFKVNSWPVFPIRDKKIFLYRILVFDFTNVIIRRRFVIFLKTIRRGVNVIVSTLCYQRCGYVLHSIALVFLGRVRPLRFYRTFVEFSLNLISSSVVQIFPPETSLKIDFSDCVSTVQF